MGRGAVEPLIVWFRVVGSSAYDHMDIQAQGPTARRCPKIKYLFKIITKSWSPDAPITTFPRLLKSITPDGPRNMNQDR